MERTSGANPYDDVIDSGQRVLGDLDFLIFVARGAGASVEVTNSLDTARDEIALAINCSYELRPIWQADQEMR